MKIRGRDITGQQFGTLTVVELSPVRSRHGQKQWVCRCSCGNVTTILQHSLITGSTTKCDNHFPNLLIGKRFTRLTVLSFVKKLRTYCTCICDCGNTITTVASNLTTETTRSCGCLQKESMSEISIRYSTVHGHNRKGKETDTHKSWSAMMSRCNCISSADYPRYGGAGITVCERWHNYENFYADMGDRPEGKSIDRINVYGNYEPLNCRWATRSEQQRNRRDNQGRW